MADEEKFYDEEELGSSPESQRNWKGIVIAVLVIICVMSMIVGSVFLLTPPDLGPRVRGKRIELNQILEKEFEVKEFNGSWISENEFLYQDSTGGLSLFDADSLAARIILPNTTYRRLNIDSYTMSKDLRYILLSEKVQQIYHYSAASKYYIYIIDSHQEIILTPTPEERGHPLLIHAQWSSTGSSIIMIDENYNMFYKKNAINNDIHRITDSGMPSYIYNGVPDWLYEEEIIKGSNALWFSPAGNFLVYAQFNDTEVANVPITFYGHGEQYVRVKNIRYPKAGQENPTFTLWVQNLNELRSLSPRDVKPPNLLKDADHYFTALTWVDEDTLSITWMNRAQNMSIITICRQPIYLCEATHIERLSTGWIDIVEPPIFSNDGQSYLVRLPLNERGYGDFMHISLYNVRMRRITPITHGKFEVTQLLGWDQNNNFIYYMATSENQPGERHLYRVADVSSPLLRQPDCLSCYDLENGTQSCLYNKAHISPDFNYYILECLGPDSPRAYLVSLINNNEVMAVLNYYDELQELVDNSALPQIKTFRVELEGRDKSTAHVQLYLPPDLREDELTQYPMILTTCAAPGSQSVTMKLDFNWGTYLASKKKIIYAIIDGRGTGFQGNRIKHEVYHKLGGKDVDDQLAVVKYLRDNLHFIDENKIAVWGWNYGGFVATMILARDDDAIFKCGMAVSPISRFEHYYSAYTERYMGSPHIHPGSNYKGYEAADTTKVAGNIKNKMFLLVHGTGDDKVHYHHSMMLAQAFTDAGVLFRQISYVDERGRMGGVEQHLFDTLNSFIADCFRPSLEELYFYIKKKKDIEEIAYL